MFRKIVIPLAAVLALAGCASPVALDPEATSTTEQATLSMTAFQGEWSDPDLISRNAQATTVVAVDGINLAAAGEVTEVNENALAQLAAAHDAGLPAELMVGNFDASLGDFSEELAWTTFSDGAATTATVNAIATIVDDQGWDGISVDMESLEARDTAALVSFVTGLRAILGEETSLGISLQLADSVEGYADAGYDLAAFADTVDRVILMGYDHNGPWEPLPGPIGSLDWQRAGLDALLQGVPAAKVELGVAGYGYHWGTTSTEPVSVAEARELAGDSALFDEGAGEWTAVLADGSTLWWSDAKSLALRQDLAEEYGLHGLALWVLGLSDPIAP